MFLGIIVIGPWALLLIYDAVLYIFRTATYDIPYIGGRARNRPRPRAPSLSERPSGSARTFSLTASGGSASIGGADANVEGLKKRPETYVQKESGSHSLIDE